MTFVIRRDGYYPAVYIGHGEDERPVWCLFTDAGINRYPTIEKADAALSFLRNAVRRYGCDEYENCSIIPVDDIESGWLIEHPERGHCLGVTQAGDAAWVVDA